MRIRLNLLTDQECQRLVNLLSTEEVVAEVERHLDKQLISVFR